jgi:pre-60S factor REI1
MESLFDGHESASFEDNLHYMRAAHGFVFPERASLVDPEGLFAHLQAKVHVQHACLCCNRRFRTLEGCRSHMIAKSHCTLDFEDEEGVVDVASFYDLDQTWFARRGMSGYTDHLGELVLPGKRLGHRTLRRAYTQKYRTEDLRLSVRAARSNAQARTRAQLLSMQRDARNGSGALLSSHSNLGIQLRLREEAKRMHRALIKSFAVAKGTSKALAASYVHKADFADNKHARALTHHGYGGFGGGAHYTMAGSKQFQKGVRVKGVVSRHSVQGARLGAARRSKAAGKSQQQQTN